MNKKLVPAAGELRDTMNSTLALAESRSDYNYDDYLYYSALAKKQQKELDALLNGEPFPHISLEDLMDKITSLSGPWDSKEIVFHGFEGRIYLDDESKLFLEFDKCKDGRYDETCEGINDIYSVWKFRYH